MKRIAIAVFLITLFAGVMTVSNPPASYDEIVVQATFTDEAVDKLRPYGPHAYQVVTYCMEHEECAPLDLIEGAKRLALRKVNVRASMRPEERGAYAFWRITERDGHAFLAQFAYGKDTVIKRMTSHEIVGTFNEVMVGGLLDAMRKKAGGEKLQWRDYANIATDGLPLILLSAGVGYTAHGLKAAKAARATTAMSQTSRASRGAHAMSLLRAGTKGMGVAALRTGLKTGIYVGAAYAVVTHPGALTRLVGYVADTALPGPAWLWQFGFWVVLALLIPGVSTVLFYVVRTLVKAARTLPYQRLRARAT